MDKQKIVYLGIGTNKGDREKNISLSLKLLQQDKHIKVLKVSKMLKNPPQEGIKSGFFLNGVIKILTTLRPFELLKLLKRIERKLGRRINTQYSALNTQHLTLSTQHSALSTQHLKKSRTIDLDILFYEDEIINTNILRVPHPRLHLRYFVLFPLLEINKGLIHPVLKKTIQELYNDLNSNLKKYA